ncbi:MAG TPA: 16S rRNA (adenine(1518)-N(6)/adenine(1519)-N(6))-dimethyltransferase RsmA [Thermodesulfobacteriota bacterium]|nr:16S rRNA (adenine(1518)-N(6)/adenine(1519)-N(6))-dimethyltransferase RsmA [Thermodesulfobacteriota bacterium]
MLIISLPVLVSDCTRQSCYFLIMHKKKTEKKPSSREFFFSKKTRPSRVLGQNFIRDQSVLERMGKIADLSEEDELLEIGAGLGALTFFLGERVRRVIAVEKDRRLVEKLRENVSPLKNIEIIEEDILETEFKRFFRGNKLKVVSNLPYSISSPVLFKLLEERELFSLLVLMLQREVGERIAAPPGGKEYGSLSVLVQTYMDVSLELNVPPEAFWPRPKVDSVVIKLIPLLRPRIQIRDEKLFRTVVRAAFSSRRKILANSLSSLLSKEQVEEILKSSGIDGRRRAETLSLEEFGRITEVFHRYNHLKSGGSDW